MPSTAERLELLIQWAHDTTRYAFLWQKWFLKRWAGDECVILLVWWWVFCVVFVVVCLFFHIFRQVMVPAWRQTLTDTELSESHEFNVVGNLGAFDARRLE